MQFMCLIMIIFFLDGEDHSVKKELLASSNAILIALVAEHIFSYGAGIFRSWEIEHYGHMDVNGVMRAQKESFLSTIEIFIDCLIMGYSLNYLNNLTPEEFNSLPYIHIWIIIDCCLMFLTLAFVYLTQKMIRKSEITKNIYSLVFIQ